MLNCEDTLTPLSAAIRIQMSESQGSECWDRECKIETLSRNTSSKSDQTLVLEPCKHRKVKDVETNCACGYYVAESAWVECRCSQNTEAYHPHLLDSFRFSWHSSFQQHSHWTQDFLICVLRLFPFSEGWCPNTHFDPFKHQPFDVHDLLSSFTFTVSRGIRWCCSVSRAFVLRDQLILSPVLEDVIHHGSQSPVALQFFLQKNV